MNKSLMILILVGWPSFLPGAEINGKVSEVGDKTITINVSSNLLPIAGDKLDVYVEIPDVGKAVVGTGTVTSVEGDTIFAKIDKATGRVAAGQLVTIISAKPQKGPARAQPALKVPKLLIVSNRTGNNDIFLMNSDGTNAKNLTNHKASDVFPAWSPDGKQIAFTSNRDGDLNIYVMDADGRNLKQVTTGKVNRAPTWSPHRKKIAFNRIVYKSDRFVAFNNFVMDADGSNMTSLSKKSITNLSKKTIHDADPAWSPDGKKIAFGSRRNEKGWGLYLMDANGANVRALSQSGRMGFVYPAWSPDGNNIAYTNIDKNNAYAIFVSDSDGKNRKQLTTSGFDTYAAWSGDGKQISFVRYSDVIKKPGSLFVMDANGKNLKEILRSEVATQGGRPAWAPK